MTLRNTLIDKLISQETLKDLEEFENFKLLANHDIVIRDDISDKDLFESLSKLKLTSINSNKFKEDLTSAMKNINIIIKKYPNYNLSLQNFLLFFSPDTHPLRIDISPLIC